MSSIVPSFSEAAPKDRAECDGLEGDDDDEPWLGAPEERTGYWGGLWTAGNDDRELDGADDEPSLAASELVWSGPYCRNSFKQHMLIRDRPDLFEACESYRSRETSQFGWANGSGDGRELDDEREPCCEDEGAQCEYYGSGNYLGACSPMATMLGRERI